MKENFYKWPMGDFKGQNVYDFPYDSQKKAYLYASIRDMKEDLQAMDNGTYIIPWSKHRGKKINQLTPWLQNEWKKGFRERLHHSERALAISYEQSKQTEKKSVFSELLSEMKDLSIVPGMLNKHHLAKLTRLQPNTVKSYMNKSGIEAAEYIKVPGVPGRTGLAYYDKDGVMKFLELILFGSKQFS